MLVLRIASIEYPVRAVKCVHPGAADHQVLHQQETEIIRRTPLWCISDSYQEAIRLVFRLRGSMVGGGYGPWNLTVPMQRRLPLHSFWDLTTLTH